MLKFLVFVLFALGITQTAAAQDNGPFQLPSGGFGVPDFGQRQALPSHAMEEARRLGLFEETVGIRSGWIDQVAKVTGRLDIMTAAKDADGQPVSLACTGTAITPRYILTNAHCLKSNGRHRAISVLFLPNYRDVRRRNMITAYPVSLTPLERGNGNTLDYAILRLETPLKDYPPLSLTIRDPGPGEPLVVIGHPEGQPLHLSRGRCRSDHEVPMDGENVIHGCATLAGSSGSLVFSSEGQIVGLHFWGGALLGGRQVNRAIRMAILMEKSTLLREIFDPRSLEYGMESKPCSNVISPEGFFCVSGSDGKLTFRAVEAAETFPDQNTGEVAKNKQLLSQALTRRIDYYRASFDTQMSNRAIKCAEGKLNHCVGLGTFFFYGRVGVKDENLGANIYLEACKAGSQTACAGIGSAYISGKGVSKSIEEGLKYLEDACEADNSIGCYRLAQELDRWEKDDPIRNDQTRAATLYTKACDSGHSEACRYLGYLYFNGSGVRRDKALALSLIDKSCRMGSKAGCTSSENYRQ